ncbi:hypothetical protein WJX77_002908 [Trebouxia sp. C0004]
MWRDAKHSETVVITVIRWGSCLRAGCSNKEIKCLSSAGSPWSSCLLSLAPLCAQCASPCQNTSEHG